MTEKTALKLGLQPFPGKNILRHPGPDVFISRLGLPFIA
jgi:hypothetical protein